MTFDDTRAASCTARTYAKFREGPRSDGLVTITPVVYNCLAWIERVIRDFPGVTIDGLRAALDRLFGSPR